ncbi:MAG: ABC transporter permease subunit [Anaerolineae bacterium]|nr:ABC transporter permease subunit [Anaerolineae bacterium]MCI0608340.1 ABC transporter permease subunit [Anaerolineae bacterium]
MKYLTTSSLRLILYLILIAPFLLFVAYAFSTRWFFPHPFPIEWTVFTFQRVLDDTRTISSMAQGLWIALLVSVLSLILGFPAARVLGLRRFRGRHLVWMLFFLPTIIPPLAIGMGLNILFLQIGLAGTIPGVVLAHIIPTLPYTIFTLSSAFARFDENYEFQALALGASPIQTFFKVTLRLMAPSLVVAILFAFLISWSQYLLTLLIGGGQIITLPILLFSAASGGNPSTIATLSLLFIAPPVLVIVATARSLNRHGNEIREQY